MKKHDLKKLSITLLSISSLFLFSASTTEYDEDVNECLQAPCPEGYICMNIPNGFICQNPETGEMTVIQTAYKIHKNPCIYTGEIDAKGYVTIWGKKIYVGISTETIWSKRYEDAQVDCEMGGKFLCKPVTCKDFWETLN
ncbi:MAG: calcium-binding EGF-like domain-containing protein [Odoribacter sp.]|nr:calcium-binding EGF-like domain-containing protein [Odoribacter sp.]